MRNFYTRINKPNTRKSPEQTLWEEEVFIIFIYYYLKVYFTQFTTGGRSDAEIATPISGPADP